MKGSLKAILIISLIISINVWATKPTVKLSTLNWPPYVGQNIPSKGYVYTIVTRAFQKAGFKTNVAFQSWHETLKSNDTDAFFPTYERNDIKNVVCSAPIYAGPIGLYKRKNSAIDYTVVNPGKNQLEALRGLKAYRFGVVKGYVNTPAFDNATFLKKSYVDTDLENIKQLENQDVDLIMIDVFTAHYLIESHKPTYDNLEFMGPSLENKQLYICFSTKKPGYQYKLAAFNRALKTMKNDGEINNIMTDYPF